MGFFQKLIWYYKFQKKQEGRSKVTTYPRSRHDILLWVRCLTREHRGGGKVGGGGGKQASRGHPPRKTVSDFLTSVHFVPPPPIHFSYLSASEVPRISLKCPQKSFSEVSKNGFQRAILARFSFSIRFAPPLLSNTNEQRQFYANKAKPEMRHFSLKRYKTRYTPVKRDRLKSPRNGTNLHKLRPLRDKTGKHSRKN